MDLDLGDGGQGRLIGNYILGARIGSGSFAVVWKSRHRQSGMEVAVKEIDKKQLLMTKLGDNLLKEISILSNIRHPNIIRLFEAIETEDRIYLVLEYCNGGDLAAYIHRRGKISEAVARHLMKQLAAGLQVLNENCLIHRDLKPQNLLLSNDESTPLLKIGDFGFARYLTPQGLADTLCGSPLYMAPEIIQNKKYDSKADLWSAGAILFQLVTGKPPFDGESQLQLFQNILTSGELRFPQGALEELKSDCINLCKGLLRQNPVERLTFGEFFNHKFLEETGNSRLGYLSVHGDDDKTMCGKDYASISSSKGCNRFMPNIICHSPRASIEVTDSMDSIEKDYVLVNAHFASTGTFSCSLEASQLCNSSSKVFTCPPLRNDWDIAAALQTNEVHSNSTCNAKDLQCNESAPLTALTTSTILREVQGLTILHPSTRIRVLRKYICSLSELAQTKFNAGLFLESFAIELIVLAIWREAIQCSGSWLASTREGDLCGSYPADQSIPAKGGSSLFPGWEENVDFSTPQSVSFWSEQGFITACNRAEKLSNHVQHMDGNVQMPDAMEVIFQTALDFGRNGGVDELMGNKGSATASYYKAKLLLSFIMEEAASLPLNPPFSLTHAESERLKGYIISFESRQSHSQVQPCCFSD